MLCTVLIAIKFKSYNIVLATTMNNHKHVARITVALSFYMHFPKKAQSNYINSTIYHIMYVPIIYTQ